MHALTVLLPLLLAGSDPAEKPSAAGSPADPLRPGTVTREIRVSETTRSYILHLPPRFDRSQSWPLVLCFHGGGSNAQTQMLYSGLNELADAEGFVVAYPNGTGRLPRVLTWNGGNCCGYALRNSVDDVAFVSALLDRLQQDANIDPRQVFATGISNGGILCYRLADELSDRIVAIASVAGTMGRRTCQPARPVPVLHFHGTDDQFLKFDGGFGARSQTRTLFLSVQHTMDQWVAANGCAMTPQVEQLPDTADDGMRVTRKTWAGGRDGAEVVLYVIEGGGHTWPGRESRAGFLGPSTRDISANQVMWEFFRKHTRR